MPARHVSSQESVASCFLPTHTSGERAEVYSPSGKIPAFTPI